MYIYVYACMCIDMYWDAYNAPICIYIYIYMPMHIDTVYIYVYIYNYVCTNIFMYYLSQIW